MSVYSVDEPEEIETRGKLEVRRVSPDPVPPPGGVVTPLGVVLIRAITNTLVTGEERAAEHEGCQCEDSGHVEAELPTWLISLGDLGLT